MFKQKFQVSKKNIAFEKLTLTQEILPWNKIKTINYRHKNNMKKMF